MACAWSASVTVPHARRARCVWPANACRAVQRMAMRASTGCASSVWKRRAACALARQTSAWTVSCTIAICWRGAVWPRVPPASLPTAVTSAPRVTRHVQRACPTVQTPVRHVTDRPCCSPARVCRRAMMGSSRRRRWLVVSSWGPLCALRVMPAVCTVPATLLPGVGNGGSLSQVPRRLCDVQRALGVSHLHRRPVAVGSQSSVK